jgi:hypothetical protein
MNVSYAKQIRKAEFTKFEVSTALLFCWLAGVMT